MTFAVWRVRFDLWLTLSCMAHCSNHTSGCRLCVKPPLVPPDKIRKTFFRKMTQQQTLTVVRLGSHLLHCIHVVDHDASGDVWPACGFAVDYNDMLHPRHVAQYCLECGVGGKKVIMQIEMSFLSSPNVAHNKQRAIQ